ncbi:MAG: hypothetical protein Q4G42_05540 [Neisseria sp.]|nr:hypothetical protein [Neisseria sp.]
MNILKYSVLSVTSLLLAGCFMASKSEIVHKNTPYNPQAEAKIRIYGPYGRSIIRDYPQTSCEQWSSTKAKRAHTRMIVGLPKKIRNQSVGMPDTQRSVAANNDTGTVFRDTYRELVIPAGSTLVLDGADVIQGGIRKRTCRTAAVFTPQAGKNYEASFRWLDSGCEVVVAEILSSNVTPATEHPTREITTTSCDKPSTSF